MSARGLVLVTAVWVCGLVCVSAIGAGSAVAAVDQFGSQGQEAGQFSRPHGIAVEQASGDVYIGDSNNNRVDEFGPDGEFKLAWGWGVADGSTSAPQTCEAVCFKGVAGAGSGQFSEEGAKGIAVDNSSGASHGDVYVQDVRNRRVEKFKPNGEFVLMFGGEVNATTHANLCVAGEACQAGTNGVGVGQFEAMAPNAIAVDSVGTVYVGGNGRVQEFNESGVFTGQITPAGVGGEILALAVDAAKDIYVLSFEAGAPLGVRKYNGSGAELGTPRDPNVGYGSPIALGPASELFVYDTQSNHIYEYESSGKQVLSVAAATQESAAESAAFGDGIKELYVLSQSTVGLVGLPPAGPLVELSSESVSEISPTSATLGATLNSEGNETSYHFEYGLGDCSSNACASTPQTVLPGGDGSFEDQPVNIGLTGLQPRTTYHYRVVVSNHCEPSEPTRECTVDGPGQEFTTLPPVSVDNESVSQVTGTSALLEAELNPHGLPTEYKLEYGLSASYEASVPVPDGNAGSGTSDIVVSALVQGLHPGATYHYRVVAHNSLGTVQGADSTFSTQGAASSGLLDGREWEMVSPADKHGAQVYAVDEYGGEGAVIEASAQGNAITYVTASPTETDPKGGYTNLMQVLAARGAGGWSSQDIGIPHDTGTGPSVGEGEEYRFFSEDLSFSVVQPFREFIPSLSAEASEQTAYIRTDYLNGDVGDPCGNGCYRPLVTGTPGYANVAPGTVFGEYTEGKCQHAVMCGPRFIDATPDLSHVVLHSEVALTSTPISGGGLYEWAGGKLVLINRLPGPGGEAANAPKLGEESQTSIRRAISDDGSRVFWTSENRLFMRDTTKEETVRLDAVQGGSGEGEVSPYFQIASSSGSKVFFTDTQRLTKNSRAVYSQPDLYECEIIEEAGELRCKLSDLTPSSGEPANVRGKVVGTSEDGSWVYFVADGMLAPGAVRGTCQGENTGAIEPEARCNLYVHHDGVTSLVAVLSDSDDPDWSVSLPGMPSRVSPDGRWLTFMSQRELTGFDTHDAVSDQPDQEVYLYNAEAADGGARLVCASCDPTGARPVGQPYGEPNTLHGGSNVWRPSEWLASNIPGWTPYSIGQSLYQARYLSNGGRLFFNSNDALVPQDVNGTWDVYEYEPPGMGDCTSSSVNFSELSAGCVGLISAGTSLEESGFLDASATGGDVFFLTTGQLSSVDRDSAVDIYDAHECNAGSPCYAVPPVAPPVCDTSDSCKAAPSPQPAIFGAPASATFTGAGNVIVGALKPAVAPKGLTRAQKLVRALKACKRKKGKRRAVCIRQARARYAGKSSKTKAIKRGRR